MKPVKNVDEYIALAPKEVQDKLKELRAAIKSAGFEQLLVVGCLTIPLDKKLLVMLIKS